MHARDWKPGCPEWTVENGSPSAEAARFSVLQGLVSHDYRLLPTVAMVKAWHHDMFASIVPHPDYAGNFRDAEHVPHCLQDYEVVVGAVRGVRSEEVLREVNDFFEGLRQRTRQLDNVFPHGDAPTTQKEVSRVVRLAAWAHGEWVRIHPFANGNGRTARLLTNYILVRYGFGPGLAVRPRPGGLYGAAAYRSMAYRDHALMEEVVWHALASSYATEP